MAVHGYRWEPDAGLYAVEGDRVVGVLDTPPVGEPAEQRHALACRLLTEAEAARLPRGRPAAMLDAMAAGFADQHLAAAPHEALQMTVDDVLAWIDGPGLEVILAFVLSCRGR